MDIAQFLLLNLVKGLCKVTGMIVHNFQLRKFRNKEGEAISPRKIKSCEKTFIIPTLIPVISQHSLQSLRKKVLCGELSIIQLENTEHG